LSDVNAGQDLGEPPTNKESKNRLATIGLTLGIVSYFLFQFVFVPIGAVVISALALEKATHLNNKGVARNGRVRALIGFILGTLMLIVWFSLFLGLVELP
jgi:hypothetical protein